VTQADRELAETQTAYEDTLADYQSTSAQLRQCQSAFAASQQDLSRCEEVRDQLREARDSAWHAHDLTLAKLTTARQELEQGRRRITELIDHNKRIAAGLDAKEDEVVALGFDLADSKAATTQLRVESQVIFEQLRQQITDLEAARTWQIARRSVGVPCSLCGEPIVRGQAFQPLADAKGYFSHCYCPDPKESVQ
jgi:DNA repair exonuclease SbcCD ATPase subunit